MYIIGILRGKKKYLSMAKEQDALFLTNRKKLELLKSENIKFELKDSIEKKNVMESLECKSQ